MIVRTENFDPKTITNMTGSSYAGAPRDNTFMYVGRKVSHLMENVSKCKDSLVFAETGIDIPKDASSNNIVVLTDTPQYDYALFAIEFEKLIIEKNRNRKYELINGSYIGENVSIGEGTYIEPNCFIDHDVSIGKNALILSGSRIRNAIIGDDFVCNENAVIGDASFTMTKDLHGNLIRIPSLGRVIIHNNVEVGACNNITSGACGDTIIEDNVKLAGLVYIAHECHISKNTFITAGVTLAGFVELGAHSYIGVGAQIKNRLVVGNNSIVGMGSTVIRDVADFDIVAGCPAKNIINDRGRQK